MGKGKEVVPTYPTKRRRKVLAKRVDQPVITKPVKVSFLTKAGDRVSFTKKPKKGG